MKAMRSRAWPSYCLAQPAQWAGAFYFFWFS
jgi:hypothetical protein